MKTAIVLLLCICTPSQCDRETEWALSGRLHTAIQSKNGLAGCDNFLRGILLFHPKREAVSQLKYFELQNAAQRGINPPQLW